VTIRLALLAVTLLASGCAIRYAQPGPVPPAAVQVTEVRVTSIPPAEAASRTISDPEKIRVIAQSGNIGSDGWWQARGQELLPLYRVDLVRKDGELATYWLGVNSYPARFPCYALCSGWWISPSTPDGRIDESRFRGMTSTQYFDFLGALGFH
jgi:hypothetical protein